jgi:trimethylamine--corrinoid protein Co-methyltransferase
MGAPESQLALYMSAQLARHYKLPFRAAGNYASSKISDAQAAYESSISIGPSLLSQPNFILHAAGWLESGLTAGYEKFVLDLETLGMYHTFLKGISWDEDQWAMESILHEVPPGGHHLGTAHTMRHFKTAFYRAELFDYQSGEAWAANGALNSEQRANKKVKEMLGNYQQPHLDSAIEEELKAYIDKRKTQITPAMIVG